MTFSSLGGPITGVADHPALAGDEDRQRRPGHYQAIMAANPIVLIVIAVIALIARSRC